MKKRRLLLVLPAVLLLCGLCILLAGSAGSSEDPLVSVSYLYEKYMPELKAALGLSVTQQAEEGTGEMDKRLDALYFPGKPSGSFASSFTPLELSEGSLVQLMPFGSFVLLEGTGRVSAVEGELLDLSTGESCAAGTLLHLRHRYFAPENSSVSIRIYGDAPDGMVDGEYLLDTAGTIPASERFWDVPDSHWAAQYIWKLAEQGVVNGVETHLFAPGDTVTRGAFVTILGRLSGADPESWSAEPFPDVAAGDWYGPYVAWAADRQIVNGFEDGSFRPKDAISREQMAVMMLRYIRSRGVALSLTAQDPFADEADVSAWALEAVNTLRDAGLMNGRGEGRFEPSGTATRAEICAVVCRLADLTGN